MSFINMFDLHCDTASECKNQGKHLSHNGLQLDITAKDCFVKWVQTFAFFIDDKFTGNGAFDEFMSQYNYFLNEVKNSNDIFVYNGNISMSAVNAVLSVEGGQVLEGNLERIPFLKQCGISFLTLVWNGNNELGSGCFGSERGLTNFGKEAVKSLEDNNIIVDISHLNRAGIDDICSICTKPIIATHSNSFAVNPHARNLTDAQLSYIIDNRGLCGINYYPLFINGENDCSLCDIRRHIDHILSVGGENILALGSDFDGAPMPSKLGNIRDVPSFYDKVTNWYGNSVANKIFFDNAMRFFEENVVVNINTERV